MQTVEWRTTCLYSFASCTCRPYREGDVLLALTCQSFPGKKYTLIKAQKNVETFEFHVLPSLWRVHNQSVKSEWSVGHLWAESRSSLAEFVQEIPRGRLVVLLTEQPHPSSFVLLFYNLTWCGCLLALLLCSIRSIRYIHCNNKRNNFCSLPALNQLVVCGFPSMCACVCVCVIYT